MVKFLKKQTAFYEVGYTSASSCAWAVFTDGRKLLIINNFDTTLNRVKKADDLVSKPLPELLQSSVTSLTGSVNYEEGPIVTGDQFRLMNMWPSLPVINFNHVTENWVDKDSIDRIGRIAKGLGFSLVDIGPNSDFYPKVCDVDGLKAVNGDGVFFITGSGGFMETPEGTIHGICTLTGAKTGAALNKEFEADLNADRLIYAFAPFWTEDGYQGSRQCFAITPKFIRDYGWSFPDESIVYLNVTGINLAEWIDPLQSAGAGLVIGWEGSPLANTMVGSAQDFFELMLGTNHISGSWSGLDTEPLMRPYGIDEVNAYLIHQGLFTGVDKSSISQVDMLYGNSGAFINALRPTIQYLSIDEINQEMQIQGEFGKIEGHVRIGSETQKPSEPELSMVGDPRLTSFDELKINKWRAGNIKVDFKQPPRETGLVQVWLGGRYSNVAHLTRWRVTFHINRSIGGKLLRSADIEIDIRAFVSGYRLSPDDKPEPQWPFIFVTNKKEFNIGYSASGSLSKTEGNTTYTETWDGAGNFNVSSMPDETLSFNGIINIADRRLDCSLIMTKQYGLHVKTETTTVNGTTTDEQDKDFNLKTPEFQPKPPLLFGPLSLYFNEDWELNAGNAQYSDNLESVLGEDNCETSITWESAKPDYPPEKDRGGR
ncbi:hypothetical protein HY745_07510 [Candidatus Desantisbacteria bacterium]|nr:hypothetical protein [Candidatus Desantisbacteria bacterium]